MSLSIFIQDEESSQPIQTTQSHLIHLLRTDSSETVIFKARSNDLKSIDGETLVAGKTSEFKVPINRIDRILRRSLDDHFSGVIEFIIIYLKNGKTVRLQTQ